ncbi:MAG: hypothetical protein NT062_17250, partial [Proteobacteria bacterium]|nr:hypothetical protein [Pseudomonadota bacterium]
AMASDPTRGQIVLFGGLDAISQNPLADTWLLAGTTWTSPLQQRPGGLANFGFARITRRDRALIFGGKSTTGPTDDTWETDGRAWRKLTPATRPSARLALAMAYDEARDEVVMFGGAGTGGIAATNATWLWDGSTWRSTTPAGSPSARSFATMAYDAARHEIVMFGGITLPSDPVAPMWIWDGSTWTSRVTPVDLEGRIFPALAYDPVRERIVLFGGSSEADTWEWDGLSWERRASNGPANRGAAAIAWDPTRRRIVMFGGNIGGTIVDELWEWDGVTWRRAFADPPPPALWGAGMVSGIEGGLLVFGGNTDLGASYASDTMILRWERTTSPPDETCRNGVDVDGDLQIGCDDPDCGWACDPTCLPETTCPANRPRCGDGACSALETCRTCPTDCTCAPVCGDQLCDPGEVCPGDC